MEKYIYKGKNKDEILNAVYNELKVQEDEIIYILNEETKLFGNKKIILEIIKIDDIANLGKNILIKIMESLNIKGEIKVNIENKIISYKIESNNNSVLIGKHGKTLKSLNTFLKQSLMMQLGININIIIDIENYNEKQKKNLERNVKQIAKEVTLSKINVNLDPMNSYDRMIVHNALSNFENIETKSIGEEPNRYIVIKYKDKNFKND